jgi:hypothetical protein
LQGLKLSACGQELGGDMLFGRRIGFSGTPSDILPLELGSCQYERGSDGRVVHYLTSPSIVQHVPIRAGWNSHLLLEFIARVSALSMFFVVCLVVVSGVTKDVWVAGRNVAGGDPYLLSREFITATPHRCTVLCCYCCA